MSKLPAKVEERLPVPGNAAPTAPPMVPGTRAMTIVPPTQMESYDVDANETASNADGANARNVPILRVLQSNSPQVADPRDGGIPGARSGSFYNIVTREVFEARDLGLFMIPVRKHRKVVEYVARNDDNPTGGFLNVYEPENPIVLRAWDERRRELGRDPSQPIFGKVPNGVVEDDGPFKGRLKELVDTYYVDSLFIVPNEDGSYPAHFGVYFRSSMAFQSSFIPVYNSWDERRRNQKYPINGAMREPALWTTVWRMRSVQSPKSRGTVKWMVPTLTLGMTDPESGVEMDYRDCRLPRRFADGSDNPLYNAAVDFHEELESGGATLDLAKDTGDEPAPQTGEGRGEDYIPGFDKD